MPSAVVIGAGLGGLSTAIRLAAAGWSVDVYEKNAEVGGRMGTLTLGPFRWDVGPTLIMMPDVLRELFAVAGRRLEDYVDLMRVDPYYRVAFEDGTHLDLTGHLPTMVANTEALEPGGGARYLRFLAAAERLYRLARPSLIERTFDGLRDLPGVVVPMLRAQPTDSVASMTARHFATDRLRRAFSFQTLYLGTRPERVPAAYVMIPFVEAAMGVWYPRGGIHTIAAAMGRVAAELGVRVHLGSPIARIVTEGGRAVGVARPDGTVVKAHAVVANAEWGYTQRALLPRGERVARRDWGCSGVLFLLAVRRRLEGPHHMFLLADDFERNLADIFDQRRLPSSPSIYVSRPTATDPGAAPGDVELLYVLVPTPSLNSGVDWAAEVPGLRARVLERLAAVGLEGLERDIVAEATLTPQTFADRYNLTEGAAFGLAATLFQSGPFRPTIRSRRWAALYHVGASSHPGGGVPIVTLSGRLAAEAICADFARRRDHAPAKVPRDAEEAWSGAARS